MAPPELLRSPASSDQRSCHLCQQAANYGDFNGSTVSFLSVQDQNGLFGAPTVSGDSLDFSPNTFEACVPQPAARRTR
jgi:hypothetical protein